MDTARMTSLESMGYQVIQGQYDPYWNTDTFIVTPDGNTLADYSSLDQIPILPQGTQFSLDDTAMPYDEIYNRPSAVVNAQAVTHRTETLSADGQQLLITFGGLLIILVVVATVICIYWLTHPGKPEPPCGTEAKTIDVSDCAKVIIMPNCDSRLYDACSDQWLEESWHTWEPPAGWVTWAVIGLGVLAAIIIVPKLFDALSQRRAQPHQYYPPSRPAKTGPRETRIGYSPELEWG